MCNRARAACFVHAGYLSVGRCRLCGSGRRKSDLVSRRSQGQVYASNVQVLPHARGRQRLTAAPAARLGQGHRDEGHLISRSHYYWSFNLDVFIDIVAVVVAVRRTLIVRSERQSRCKTDGRETGMRRRRRRKRRRRQRCLGRCSLLDTCPAVSGGQTSLRRCSTGQQSRPAPGRRLSTVYADHKSFWFHIMLTWSAAEGGDNATLPAPLARRR